MAASVATTRTKEPTAAQQASVHSHHLRAERQQLDAFEVPGPPILENILGFGSGYSPTPTLTTRTLSRGLASGPTTSASAYSVGLLAQ